MKFDQTVWNERSSKINHASCIIFIYNLIGSTGFGVAENKATMMLVSGIPLGPPRLPLLKCSEEKKAQILAKLKILGLLN